MSEMTPFPRHSVLFQSTPNLGGSAIIQSSRLEIFSTNRIRVKPITSLLKRAMEKPLRIMWLWQLPVSRTIPRWFPTPPASRSFLSRECSDLFLLKKSWDAYEVGYDYRLELICNPIYPSNMFGHFYGLLRYNSIVLTRLRGPSCIDLGSHTPTTPSPWWARRLMLPLSAGNFSPINAVWCKGIS